MPAIMIQGTGSNVGKSTLVAGLCRAARRRSISVAPFKPQNMSNNAAVTVDGGEIGRAQALQALASGLAPHTDMNPVLLKPETDVGAQVVVQGKRRATLKARAYAEYKPTLMAPVLESFRRLTADHDLVLVEGAGSPAEVNLRAGDIANMGFAEAADLPVILCADIDRGGVIASVVGTHAVLEPQEQNRIRGFFINRFRGDPRLFDDGMREIAVRTGWRGLGVVPWFADAGKLPSEDALGLEDGFGQGNIKIVVPVISRIANFDDLDPLRLEPGVTLELVRAGDPLPGDADVVLLPGSKSTVGDLAFFRGQGWDIDLIAHHRRGGQILGVCGGYQMLGKTISDPDGIEGSPGTVEGLGLLDVDTVLTPDKSTVHAHGTHIGSGAAFAGYEIHIGKTAGADCDRPMMRLKDGRAEGAVSADGLVCGTYVHGLFTSDSFRAAYLASLGASSDLAYERSIDRILDDLAAHLGNVLDVDAMYEIAAAGGS